MTTLFFFLPFTLLYIILVVYAERKVSAFIQDRMGPMETGKYGLLQTIADLLKLLQKESITPKNADTFLFAIAPFVFFVAVFTGFAFVPIAAQVGVNIEVGLLLLFGVISLDILGILAAGWGSNNKYSLFGAVRAVAQIVSYEIPMGLAVLCVAIFSQSIDLQEITLQQGYLSTQSNYLFGLSITNIEITQLGGFLNWNIFRYPLLFFVSIIFFIASLAEANRAPFDLSEAESEIIAGFHTEYSGVQFAMLMLAEYTMLLLMSMLVVLLFLGGWNTPLLNIGSLQLATWTTGETHSVLALFWGVFWLFSKTFAIIALKMWIRWTYPRLRIDQLMTLCWKYLTPFGLVLLLLCSLWKICL
jgi:NADH-quinone oxidoreductase subunit H